MSIATKPASLQFDRIQFTYPGGKQIAIDDVNIDVKPGELVVLVGPSGC
jgi:ABC-type multidrug transport system fused ATPase/permease subunit